MGKGYEKQDMGAVEIGEMFGVCIGMYVRNGVQLRDVLALTRDIYDGICKRNVCRSCAGTGMVPTGVAGIGEVQCGHCLKTPGWE